MITREQQEQQQRAVYGLPSAFDPAQMTPEQLRQVTEWVMQQNAQNTGIVKEFDLNHPPTPPYRHQEFPKMLYRMRGKEQQQTIVRDQYHMEAMLRDGWKTEPCGPQAVDIAPELDPQSKAEVKAIDEIAHPKPPKKAVVLSKAEKDRARNQRYRAKKKAEAAAQANQPDD